MDYEQPRISLAVLRFVADHPATFGRHRTARILVGRINEDDLDRAPTLPVEPLLAGETQARIVRAIDELVAAGIVAKSFGDRPRLALTRCGWRFLAALELDAAIGGSS